MVAEGARSRRDGPVHQPTGGEKVRPAAEVTETNPVGFNQLIHGRVRLGIVSSLAVEDSLTFNELKDRLQTSDGNLSVHARRLEEAGYLEVTKSFDGRIPRTDYRLTAAGRKALERYLDHMEALIERVRE
jgi:DNA-binding MarR family transcriptional regulator